jgi:hypothetical protein
LQTSWPGNYHCNNFLSSSSATLPNVGRLKLRISLIYPNSTCDLGIINDPTIWIL